MVLLLIIQIIIFVVGIVLISFGVRVAAEEKESVTIFGAMIAAIGVCASGGTLAYFFFATLPHLLSP